MKKSVICLLMCLALASLQACGANANTGSGGTGDQQQAADEAPAKEPEEEPAQEAEDAPDEEVSASASSQGELTEEIEALAGLDLKKVLMENEGLADGDIHMFHQNDFDGDGKDEAFVLVGTVPEDDLDTGAGGLVEGSVWFVNDNGCTKLAESSGMGFSAEDRVMKLGEREYVLIDDVYATGYMTYVWSVSGDKAQEAEISKVGFVRTDLDGANRFRIQDSSYDCEYDAEIGEVLGHSWKDYYFYYDTDEGKICEYGGTDIDSKTADDMCGMPFADKLLQSGDKQTELFFRDNGLVVLDFERPDGDNISYCHYIYDTEKGCFIDDGGEETTDEEPLSGTYLKALCPDLATYPKAP